MEYRNTRPAFLRNFPADKTGADLIAAFQALPIEARREVDRWLVWAVPFGSLTWQERALWVWIENGEMEVV